MNAKTLIPASLLIERSVLGQYTVVELSNLKQALVRAHYEGFNRSFSDINEIEPTLFAWLENYLTRNFSEEEKSAYLADDWLSLKLIVRFMCFHHHKAMQPFKQHVRVQLLQLGSIFLDITTEDWDAFVLAGETDVQAFENALREEAT